ncbi:DUF4259 domain-containing protein [Microbulbifer aggregans]|uniref:DUF4259 domain-containing protein n=1 Tax=Microbulbifer aggregans TaxID=1769779 RepID=UPI001CFDA652|nr:DUF4259 domain-containing protein [Microbulbifer aggregans]
MGAWGVGYFENDMALDWIGPIQNHTDEAPIRNTFERAISEKKYLVVDDGAEVIAAAATLSHLLGAKDIGIPEELNVWIKSSKFAIDKELVDLALSALDRTCADDSEIKELWEGNPDYYPQWTESVVKLRTHILASI